MPAVSSKSKARHASKLMTHEGWQTKRGIPLLPEQYLFTALAQVYCRLIDGKEDSVLLDIPAASRFFKTRLLKRVDVLRIQYPKDTRTRKFLGRLKKAAFEDFRFLFNRIKPHYMGFLRLAKNKKRNALIRQIKRWLGGYIPKGAVGVPAPYART
jgi:hypothetical protein